MNPEIKAPEYTIDLKGFLQKPVIDTDQGWEGNEGNGIIHRSPAASEQTPRLVLTLDLLAD